VLHSLGRSFDAEPYCRRALEARERVLGPEHPATLTSVNNLGAVLHALGRSEEALRCFLQALEGRERILGPDHLDTQSTREWIEALSGADDAGG